jgi:hypothetical protein
MNREKERMRCLCDECAPSIQVLEDVERGSMDFEQARWSNKSLALNNLS